MNTVKTDTDNKHLEDSTPTGPTSFYSDAVVLHTKPISPLTFDSELLNLPSTNFDQTIITFLEKPLLLRSGVWNTSSTMGSQLNAIDAWGDWISNHTFSDKLSGFYGFRATTVLRLVVNANRFQQGRLIMSFIPQAQANGIAYPYSRTQSINQITQLPNVQLDANTDSTAILEVPYVSPFMCCNLIDGTGYLGGFFLHVYSPLVAPAGSSNANYQIWGYLKDIELFAPAAPQTYWTAQSGKDRTSSRVFTKKNASDEETFNSRPVSTVLGALQGAASSLSKIPIISSFAGTAAWALGILKGAAHAFGFSNPLIESSPQRIVVQPFVYSNNCDTQDTAQNLALLATNKVDILPSLGRSNVDEMLIENIAKIPSYYTSWNWTSSDASETRKYIVQLTPNSFAVPQSVVTSGGTFNGYYPTPMWYLSRNFTQWRGDICFRLKFVKTEFHSGRLMISYSPGSNNSVSYSDLSQVHRDIIDIRETNEYTFKCPYVSNLPYLNTDPIVPNPYFLYGYLFIHVVNPLVAPATVSGTITVLMEAWMENADFAFPKPLHIAINQYGPACSDTYLGNFTTQSAREFSSTLNDSPNDEPIGKSDIPKVDLSPARFCVGEKITSILQLLKRSVYAKIVPSLGTTIQTLTVRPDIPSICGYTSSTSLATGDLMYDTFNIWTPCFAYHRGGVRYRLLLDSTTPAGGSVPSRNISTFFEVAYGSWTGDQSVITVSTSAWVNPGGPHSVIQSGTNDSNGVEINAPFYHTLPAKLTTFETETASPPFDPLIGAQLIHFVNSTNNGTSANGFGLNTNLMRQVSDDFQLAFWLCTPLFIDS